MDSDYRAIWSDLPESSAISYAPRKWRRGRTWGQGEWRYTRPSAIPLVVSAEAHAMLRHLTGILAQSENQFCEYLQREFDAGRIGLAEGDKPAWDKNAGKRHLNVLSANMTKAGIDRNSTDWHARERCCARLFSSMRNRVIVGRRPTLDWADREYLANHDWTAECPPGLNLRVAAGQAHRKPVIEGEHGWLGIDSLGWVWSGEALEGGLRPSEAAYVEVSQFGRQWHARFVYADPNDDRRNQINHAPVVGRLKSKIEATVQI